MTRVFKSWNHFAMMLFGQFSGQDSLRGIEAGQLLCLQIYRPSPFSWTEFIASSQNPIVCCFHSNSLLPDKIQPFVVSIAIPGSISIVFPVFEINTLF
ncbi:MAG: DUF4372 domain-containing protein [Spirochaetales bacterium]|nr:DUF4372 domain-containing protein [Spirochaetales bacterium]